MTPEELRLRCLELAMAQAKAEGKHADREVVAKIATEFYNLVSGQAPKVAEPQPSTRKNKADKAPEIFS